VEHIRYVVPLPVSEPTRWQSIEADWFPLSSPEVRVDSQIYATYAVRGRPVCSTHGWGEFETIPDYGAYFVSRAVVGKCNPGLTVGADPEFEIWNPRTRRVMSASEVFDGRRLFSPIGTDGYDATGEFRPRPVWLIRRRDLIDELGRLVSRVYNMGYWPLVSCYSLPTGCHIHVGCDCNCHRAIPMAGAVGQFLDAWGEVAKSVRGGYAAPGAYEIKSYGWEYRTLPAFAYLTPELFGIILDAVDHALFTPGLPFPFAEKLEWYRRLCLKLFATREPIPALWRRGWRNRLRELAARFDSAALMAGVLEFRDEWNTDIRRRVEAAIQVPAGRTVRLFGLAECRGDVWTADHRLPLPSGRYLDPISITYSCGNPCLGLPRAFRMNRYDEHDTNAVITAIQEEVRRLCA
jgi:hypothetical protein